MSPIAQFGLAALLATSAFAAPAAKRDLVVVTKTVYAGAAPTAGAGAAPAPAPVVPAPVSHAANHLHKPAHKPVTPVTSGKAGIPYNDGSLTNMFANTKVTWAYDWVSSPQGVCSSLEFVPMLHDTTSTFTSVWQSEAEAAIASGSKHVIGFNEPDLAPGTGGTGISVGDAAAAWKSYMEPLAGKVKLGSPGVTNGAAPMGIAYLQSFMSACSDCTVDFMNIHWYDQCTNFAALKQHLSDAHAAFPDKPIWLSEFGCYGSDDQVSSFLSQAQPYMDSLPWLHRYAYFMAEEGKLVSNGALSSYGAQYANE